MASLLAPDFLSVVRWTLQIYRAGRHTSAHARLHGVQSLVHEPTTEQIVDIEYSHSKPQTELLKLACADLTWMIGNNKHVAPGVFLYCIPPVLFSHQLHTVHILNCPEHFIFTPWKVQNLIIAIGELCGLVSLVHSEPWDFSLAFDCTVHGQLSSSLPSDRSKTHMAVS